MKCLVNLIPIKKGGGQQVASNFIIQLIQNQDINPVFLVSENTYIHRKLLELGAGNVYVIKQSLKDRLFFQLFRLKKIINKHDIEIIYTMFGPGIHYNGVKSVTGCAYSNLFFPEVDFWQDYSFFQRIRLRLIDKYRLSSTLRSEAIVFENAAMMKRAHSLFNFPESSTKLIFPSVSEYSEVKIDEEFQKRLSKINSSHFNILMLTGWHKNKNIEIIPQVLNELKMLNVRDVSFVITVAKEHPDSIKLMEVARSYGVDANIYFYDAVKPDEVPLLFDEVNAVMLLSLLESFSNNIIEAWHFKKPLFISDKEWSRSICKEAAVYVERDDSKKIAEVITKYRTDISLQKQIAINSDVVLSEYPNPKQKVELQINFLKEVLNG